MFHVPVKQFLDAGGIHPSPHLCDGTVHHTPPGAAIGIIGWPSGELSRHLVASFTANLDEKFMAAVFEDLRQG
jgi:hypothetical protein